MRRKLRRLRIQLIRELALPKQAEVSQRRRIKIITQKEVIQPSQPIIIITILETNRIRTAIIIIIKEEANLNK